MSSPSLYGCILGLFQPGNLTKLEICPPSARCEGLFSGLTWTAGMLDGSADRSMEVVDVAVKPSSVCWRSWQSWCISCWSWATAGAVFFSITPLVACGPAPFWCPDQLTVASGIAGGAIVQPYCLVSVDHLLPLTGHRHPATLLADAHLLSFVELTFSAVPPTGLEATAATKCWEADQSVGGRFTAVCSKKSLQGVYLQHVLPASRVAKNIYNKKKYNWTVNLVELNKTQLITMQNMI